MIGFNKSRFMLVELKNGDGDAAETISLRLRSIPLGYSDMVRSKLPAPTRVSNKNGTMTEIEDPGAAVVALQLALAAGDRHRGPAAAATAQFAGRVGLERRRVEADRAARHAARGQAREQRVVEATGFERLDAVDQGAHGRKLRGSRRSRLRSSSARMPRQRRRR